MEVLNDRPAILKLIQNVAVEQGLLNYKISEIKPNQNGEGYLSLIYFVTVTDTTRDKQLDVIVKASFNNEGVEASTSLTKCGENEIWFYSKVCNTFEEFQERRKIKNQIKLFPKCYKIFLNNQQQLLCLENLKKVNFGIIDKRDILDHDHISLIFRTYGKFHALSFALRDQESEKFSKISKGLYNMYLQFINDESMGFCQNLKEHCKLAYNCLIPGEDDEVINKFQKYLGEGIVNTLKSIVEEENNFFVIIHGDCWSNNLMFKYEKTKVVDLRLVDLQLSKLGSPVCDLSNCLYTGSSKEIFDNIDQYLRIYHDSLTSFLKELGSESEKLLPFAVLKDHWKKYAKFGVLMATMVLKIKLTSSGNPVDTSENANFDKETYQKRIRDLLRHSFDFDLL